jgi:hypothetical protein
MKPLGKYRFSEAGCIVTIVHYEAGRDFPYLGYYKNCRAEWYDLEGAEFVAPLHNWVDIDLENTRLSDFPITGRVSDNGSDWEAAEIIGYRKGVFIIQREGFILDYFERAQIDLQADDKND